MNKFMFSIFFVNLCFSQLSLQACEPKKKEEVESRIRMPIGIPMEIYQGVAYWGRKNDAAEAYYVQYLNSFLKRKGSLEVKDKYRGNTLLLLAASAGNQALVKHLLGMSANIQAKNDAINLITGKKGNDALALAIYYTHPSTVKTLLEYGAKIDPRYLEYAQHRYEHYREGLGEEHKAEGFKKIVDLLQKYTQRQKIISDETGIPKDVIESIILPYETEINIEL